MQDQLTNMKVNMFEYKYHEYKYLSQKINSTQKTSITSVDSHVIVFVQI